MRSKLAVVPEKCSGCRVCEIACAVHREKTNNPKKARVRVMTIYPHPVVRMPVVCSQCKDAKCMSACPTDAIYRKNGVVLINVYTYTIDVGLLAIVANSGNAVVSPLCHLECPFCS